MKRQGIWVGRVCLYESGKKRTYWVRFSYRGDDFKFSLGVRYKQQAMKKATQIAAEIEAGTYRREDERQESSPVSITEAINQYLDFLTSSGRAQKTLSRYRGELTQFCRFLTSKHCTKLEAVTIRHLDGYRSLRGKTTAERTVHHESVVIKQLFKWSKRRALIDANPLADYELQKPRPKKTAKPTLAQVKQLIEAASEPRKTQYVLLAFGGMRSSEMRHFLKGDVDLTNGWFHIVSRAGARTKTQEDRKVPIHPGVRPFLTGFPQGTGSWFFSSPPSLKYPSGDNWLNVKLLNEDFKSLCRKLGLPTGRGEDGFTIHSLRGFFKSHCVNSGVPMAVVDSWLGHTMRSNPSDFYYCLPDDVSAVWMARVPFFK